jgi:hypothetical protein
VICLLTAMASGAVAQPASAAPLSSGKAQIPQLVPDADLRNLFTSQHIGFRLLFGNSANLRAGEDPAQRIKVILAAGKYRLIPHHGQGQD